MGNPNFSYYTITDATTHTGGFNASIKVNSSNVFLSYADSGLVRAAIVPLSGGTPSGVYTYRTIYIDPSYNVGSNSLIVDSAKAYAFWGMSGGSPLRFASSTNLLLSSWSTPMELAGEQNNLSPTTQFSLFDGTFYVLHESYSGPHTYSLRLSTSSDGGVTWNSGYVDDSAGLDASASAMSVSGSTQYIVYSTSSSHPNGYSITLKKSLDGGTTW
jgi:hypothetical protein